MEVSFKDDFLARLEIDGSFTNSYPPSLVKAFRKKLQAIRSAVDERDFRHMKSWHFEKLKGKRKSQHSVRLNKRFRLVFKLKDSGEEKNVEIIEIENYH